LKILLVIPGLGPVYGGPSIIVPNLAVALARQGLTVDVVTTDANGSARLDVPTHTWCKEQGYRVRYFRRLGRLEYKISLSLLLWLLRHVRDYDVVHAVSLFNFPILACALACRLRSVPLVLNPQGMLEPWALSHNRWKKWLYYLLIEKPNVLAVTSAIHALTVNEARNIATLGLRRPTFVVPNGVDVDFDEGDANAEKFFAAFPAARGKRLILFLHRIDPKKGLDLLAKSFATVHKQYPDTHLIVAGPDLYRFWPIAHGFFTSRQSDAAVTYTGMLNGRMKRAAFAAASIFVAPSYSEGFSMSVLEAMATGLPCVLTTGCNFPEAAAAGAAVEIPIDSAALAEALIKLINNPSEAQLIGQRARRFIREGYTWHNVARKIASAYDAILSGSVIPYSLAREPTADRVKF
jgi:glycosyltransferase involved in cell wall biosynthesis